MTGAIESTGQAGLPTANSTKSFWHSDPSEVLLGHRTTTSLPTQADLVIVGSGISGSCAAHFLREDDKGRDLNIVMLEAREACWGATGRVSRACPPSALSTKIRQNGGHCQPILYSRPPEIAAFELRNYQTLKTLVDKHNIPCEWKSLSGVHAYMDESMFKTGLEAVNELAETDPELAKLIKVVTKDSKNPSLDDLRVPSAAGAFVQANAASLWPYKLVCWILENLLSLNKSSHPSFNLQTLTPVSRLQKADDGSWIVHTTRGMIASKRVILTTNGYTSHLAPSFSDLIVPVRGEMSSLMPPKSMRPASTNQPLNHSYVFIGHGKQNINQDDYLVQRPFALVSGTASTGGELMFGGGRSYASNAGLGVSDDSSVDDPAAAYLRRELNVVLDLQNKDHELEATYEWSGIMGYSRDNSPWVGELKDELGLGGGEGLWVCAGFTGHGMPNTCLSARAAVEMMMGKPVDKVDLPGVYRLTKERVDKAKMLEEVHIADAAAQAPRGLL